MNILHQHSVNKDLQGIMIYISPLIITHTFKSSFIKQI